MHHCVHPVEVVATQERVGVLETLMLDQDGHRIEEQLPKDEPIIIEIRVAPTTCSRRSVPVPEDVLEEVEDFAVSLGVVPVEGDQRDEV